MLEDKVSVIIPVYNTARFLDQCIESVVLQTYKNLEILLVNDGSTDTSWEICRSWEKKDFRIHVINQENKGLSDARNAGIEVASGKYLTFLDSDDWLNPTTISQSLTCLREQNCDLVMWQMIKEYDGFSIQVEGPFGQNRLFSGTQMTQLHRRLTGPIGHEKEVPQWIDSFASAWGKLYKKEIIDANTIRFTDTKIIGSEDILFNFYYFAFCSSSYYLHEHLIHYRKDNPYSLTKTHGSTLFPRFVNLFSYLETGIKELGLSGDFKQALQNRISISMMNIGLSETSPRNQKNSWQQISSIKQYLNHETYRKAYSQFSLQFLPFHWKLFFWFCKIRWAMGVYFMLRSMRLFIK